MPGTDGPGSIHLFREQHPGQAVWQCKSGQRPAQISSLQTRFCQAIRTADQKCEIAGRVLPIREFFSQCGTGELFTVLVQRNDEIGRPDLGQDLAALGFNGRGGILVFAPPPTRQRLQAKLPLTWQALCVFRKCFVDPARLPITDRN